MVRGRTAILVGRLLAALLAFSRSRRRWRGFVRPLAAQVEYQQCADR